MAKGFFSRFGRTEATQADSKAEQLPPQAAPTPPLRPASEADRVARIAREISRQELPSAARKEAISLRLDADVLDWFKARGPGYQTRINAVLRAYKDAAG